MIEDYSNSIGDLDYKDLYTFVVEKYNNTEFVEIGSFRGTSAVFMAVQILNKNKNIKLNCIDPWEDTDEAKLTQPERVEEVNKNGLYFDFIKNIEKVKDYINPIRSSSFVASNNFKNESVDFVFVDGDHSYQAVLMDLKLWWPKLKNGGIMAGHDFWASQIRKAVEDFCLERNLKFQNTSTSCFLINK
jgi:predicted O-methyltransferase YrrM